ncbi:MAG: ATP-binding protein, partial [Pseudomonadota bacterium]
ATIVEQAPTTILLTDTSGRIEYANAKFEALTGWSRAEIAGQTPAFLQSGDTSAAGYSEIRARLARGESWRGVFRNLRKDGSSYWAETTILPLLGPDGAVRNFAGLGEDITEARKARDHVVRAQKLEAVGQLAGGVAHDFNNILTTVIASAYLASLDAPEGSDIAHEIAQIDVAARRAQSLVRELLTFARREPGQRQPVVLAEIVAEVVALMRAAIPPVIELRFDPPERRFTVLGDATHLHQIVMNQCRNATEAIGAGSGVIEITLAAAPGDQVRLSVRDDGPGMSQDTLCHLFEPFFTTKAVGKGSGLGLSVVFTLVEEMGGRIDVSSEIGAGARFDIDLPLTGDAAEGADAAEPELPRGSERVLLIDDEAEVAGSFRRLLLRLGYRVDAFTAPRQALDRFRRDPDAYDLVVTDLIMPDLSGLELAARLREVRPNVPILFVTAFRPGEIAIPGPVPETLEKPVNPNRFAHHIRKALDGGDISTR